VASNTSKTARASVRAGQAGAAGGALSVLGEFKYLIPLNNGKHAYVRNLTNGRTLHLRTDSDAFVEEIRTLAGAGHAQKIRVELKSLASAHPDHGWDVTEQRLADAGVSRPAERTGSAAPLPGAGCFRMCRTSSVANAFAAVSRGR